MAYAELVGLGELEDEDPEDPELYP